MRNYFTLAIVLILSASAFVISSCTKSKPPWFNLETGQAVTYDYHYESNGSYLAWDSNYDFEVSSTGLLTVVVFASNDGYTLGFTFSNLEIGTEKIIADGAQVSIPFVVNFENNGTIKEILHNENSPGSLNDHLENVLREFQVVRSETVDQFNADIVDSVGEVTATFLYATDRPQVTRNKLKYLKLLGEGFGTQDVAVIEESFFQGTFSQDSNWFGSVEANEKVAIRKNAGHEIKLDVKFHLKPKTVTDSHESDSQSFLNSFDSPLKRFAEEQAAAKQKKQEEVKEKIQPSPPSPLEKLLKEQR